MKNIRNIIIFLGIILALNISYVMAENIPISIQGDDVVELEEEQIAIVKLSTQQAVGVISGKIECSSEIKNVEVKGKNSWVALYNSETKQFTIYKAEGATEEEFMEIIFTVGNTKGTAELMLKELKMTTMQYETIEIPNEITKEIAIKDKEDISEEDYEEYEEYEEYEYDETIEYNDEDGDEDGEQTTKTGVVRIIVIVTIVILILGVIVGLYFYRKKNIIGK